MPGVPVATLATEPLLLAEEARAPEFNQFVIELCRLVGFVPTVYRGTVDSIRGGGRPCGAGTLCRVRARLVRVLVAGIAWVEPVSRYPWSVLWRTRDSSEHVCAVVTAAAGCPGRWAGCTRRTTRLGKSQPAVLSAAVMS